MAQREFKYVFRFVTIDGCRETRRYKTLAGAQKWAQHMLGEHPDISQTFNYAVGPYGDAKIVGLNFPVQDLFPGSLP
jgi:hypothetical protein